MTMSYYRILTLLLLTSCSPLKSRVQGEEQTNSQIEAVKNGLGRIEFIRDGDREVCTVNLIAKNYALTAAHCVNIPGEDKTVFWDDGVTTPFTQVVVSPSFDMAILKLESGDRKPNAIREVAPITLSTIMSGEPLQLWYVGYSNTTEEVLIKNAAGESKYKFDGLLQHRLNTYPGSSGSLIYVGEKTSTDLVLFGLSIGSMEVGPADWGTIHQNRNANTAISGKDVLNFISTALGK